VAAELGRGLDDAHAQRRRRKLQTLRGTWWRAVGTGIADIAAGRSVQHTVMQWGLGGGLADGLPAAALVGAVRHVELALAPRCLAPASEVHNDVK
jgi:hypothetical protein